MKQRIAVIVISVALLFSVDTIQASPEDSLRNVISNSEGVEKLNALLNLMNLKQHGEDGI